MSKWEYCWVISDTVTYYTVEGKRTVQFKEDKAKGDKDHSDAIARYIATLGLEGWELVSVDNGWHFKRPVLG